MLTHCTLHDLDTNSGCEASRKFACMKVSGLVLDGSLHGKTNGNALVCLSACAIEHNSVSHSKSAQIQSILLFLLFSI